MSWALLLSLVPALGQTLEIDGTCPGLVDITATDLPASSSVFILHSASRGSDSIPVGPCEGELTGLSGLAAAGPLRTDAAGSLALSPFLGAGVCGRHVQALAVDGCVLSTVATVPEAELLDADGDGYSAADGDCDDADVAVYPGAAEACNGIDDDCDGIADDDACHCPAESVGGRSYLVCTDDRQWAEARDNCAADGYHLVTIEDEEENRALATMLSDYGFSTSYWHGYNDLDVEGDWVWDDGTVSSYDRWNLSTGEPNGGEGENCGMIYVLLYDWHGLWNDESCTSGKRYVCEFD